MKELQLAMIDSRQSRLRSGGRLFLLDNQVIWNGTDSRNRKLESSIYYYRPETKKYSKTRKLVMLKQAYHEALSIFTTLPPFKTGKHAVCSQGDTMNFGFFSRPEVKNKGLELRGMRVYAFDSRCCLWQYYHLYPPTHPGKEAGRVHTLCIKIIVAQYSLASVYTPSRAIFPHLRGQNNSTSQIKQGFAFQFQALQ